MKKQGLSLPVKILTGKLQQVASVVPLAKTSVPLLVYCKNHSEGRGEKELFGV